MKKDTRASQRVSTAYKVPEKSYLIIDRFKTYCRNCGSDVVQATKTCPKCRRTFTHVSTSYTCPWMSSVVQTSRPDLIFVAPVDAFSDSELHL